MTHEDGDGKGIVLNKRTYRTFLSHAHADKAIVDRIFSWADAKAGVKVWYDGVHFPTGMIASKLGEAILDCQSAIIVLSEASIASKWVETEWNICKEQQRYFHDFQIVPVRIDGCRLPTGLGIHKCIDLHERNFTPEAATQLLEALHWHETEPAGAGRRPVYFARGSKNDAEWRAERAMSSRLHNAGLRAVRDAPDHKSMVDARVRMIMRSCAGLVVLLPHRGGGKTSSYMLRELQIARDVGLPVLAVVEQSVADAPEIGDGDQLLRIANLDGASEPAVAEGIDEFVERLVDPPRPAHCFFGHAFKGPDAELFALARRCVQGSTGIACISGDEIFGGNAFEQIAARIRDATCCIFDITEDRLNSCVEAGIAIGAGTPFEIIAKGPRRKPPYMLRTHQLYDYEDGTELIGLVRKLSAPYRRVVN